jgi:hypothetical protein
MDVDLVLGQNRSMPPAKAPAKGVDMKDDAVLKKDESNRRTIVTCSCCDRVLTNPKEFVHSRKRVICASCYESLLNPFQKRCCSGAVI